MGKLLAKWRAKDLRRLISAVSIGRLFALCMIGAGLLVLLVAGRAVLRDVRDYIAHDRSSHAGLALDAALRAMEMLSIERGPSFVLLNNGGKTDPGRLTKARGAAAKSLAILNAQLATLSDSEDTPANGRIELLAGARDAVVTAWLTSHRMIDDGLTPGTSTHDQAEAYAHAEVEVQRRFVPLLNGLQARMASGAADSAAIIQIARYAADLRELAGIQATLVTPAIAQRRSFSPEEQQAIERTQGKIDLLYAQIDAAIDYVGNPPNLLDAWHLAQAGYFTGGRALIEQTLASGTHEGRFPFTLLEFVGQFTPKSVTLVGLRNAASTAAISIATRSRDLSRDRVILSVCVLLLVLAAVSGMMVYFTRRVVTPLIELTAKVGRLASGDRAVEFETASRQDEVGGLARAMEMFRNALIANEELQEQLLQSQKMQAIGTMAGGVAHELNNLLQPILILVELLGDRLPEEDSESREEVAVILDHADRARQIVSSIVTFARKTPKNLATLDILAEIREAGSMIRSLLPTTVGLEARIATGSCLVAVDRTELMQVLTNLLVNAAQAMNNRGQLQLVVEQTELSESRSAALNIAPGNYASLSVIDNGAGIDASIIKRIFEPFFTTKPAGQGTGLGLSVAYGIVRGWKGAFQVDSKLGCGTTFSVLIPVTAQ